MPNAPDRADSAVRVSTTGTCRTPCSPADASVTLRRYRAQLTRSLAAGPELVAPPVPASRPLRRVAPEQLWPWTNSALTEPGRATTISVAAAGSPAATDASFS